MSATPTSSPDPLIAVVRAATEVLDANAIPYAVAGGIAVAVWGEPRATFDVDFLVFVPNADQERLCEAFRKDARFPIEPNVIPLTPNLTIVRAHFPDDSGGQQRLILVDCLVVPNGFAQSAMARRARAEFFGTPLWVASREDLIVMKLDAGRIKDQEDIRQILSEHRDRLDFDYIAQWADLRGTRALWDQLLAAPQ